MDFSVYTEILKRNIIFWLIILAIAAIFFLSFEVIYLKSKNLNKKEDSEARNNANLGIFLFILVLAFALYNTIPSAIDIANENYISVHGEYSTRKSDGRIEIFVKTDGGEHFTLTMPARSGLITNGIVELGEHKGTIWYAEKSEFIVDFVPDEIS